MARIIRFLAVLVIVFMPLAACFAQDKSVRPGINDPFRSPNVVEWVTKFEGESREIYQKREEIVAACMLKTGMTVADVGAGTGLYTRLFAEAVGKEGTVYAVDISPKFLEHIESSAEKLGATNVKTILGTEFSVELPEASVGLVFICDTYHHFEYPAKMMQSIHKALKPGGRVVLIDFIRIPGESSEWVMGHVRAGQEWVEKEIAECGFRKTAEIKGLLQENYVVVLERASIDKEP
jgi:ubiquinone/menaquinone biosynthesis C-methylase UbiE